MGKNLSIDSFAGNGLRVKEGLGSLNTLTLQEVTVKDQPPFQQIPASGQQNNRCLLKILPTSNVSVVTRKNRREVHSTL